MLRRNPESRGLALFERSAAIERFVRLSLLPACWKRIHSSDGLKNSDNLSITRQLRDEFLLVFRHEWRRIKSKKFFVLFVKLAILVSTAKGLPEYLGEFLRCAWGQINQRSDSPKNPRHEQNLALYRRPHERLDFRQMGKLTGTMSFG